MAAPRKRTPDGRLLRDAAGEGRTSSLLEEYKIHKVIVATGPRDGATWTWQGRETGAVLSHMSLSAFDPRVSARVPEPKYIALLPLRPFSFPSVPSSSRPSPPLSLPAGPLASWCPFLASRWTGV
ncbi:unnamed protein product, partial [Prorocentrum cordatum]